MTRQQSAVPYAAMDVPIKAGSSYGCLSHNRDLGRPRDDGIVDQPQSCEEEKSEGD